MAEEKVRKTTAKKTVRRTTTKVAPRKTPVRRTAASTATSASSKSPSTQTRKAPSRTTPASTQPLQRKNKKKFVVITVFFLAVFGASVGIGLSDRGQINVSDVIATRKQNATPEEKQTFETIPVQQTQTNVVNGGLVGSSDQAAQTPPVQEVSPLASSTEQTATSTETVPVNEETDREESEPVTETVPEEAIPEQTAQ